MSPQQIRGLFRSEPKLHNDAQAKIPSPLVRAIRNAVPWASGTIIDVTTDSARWGNALSFSLPRGPLSGLARDDAITIECTVRVHDGALGIGVMDADGSTFASRERIVRAGSMPTTARVWVCEPSKAHQLMFRNVSDASRTHFELLQLGACRQPGGKEFRASWSAAEVKTIPLVELNGALDWAQGVWDCPFPSRKPTTTAGAIQVVNAEDLPSVLGGDCPLSLPASSRTKSLVDWKMETDDAPILESLWRSQMPRRHLEFGTWEGFGAALVARVTSAEIWTVNLPEGETDKDGVPLYASTDAGDFIGRLYREAGFTGRVHQVLCDSRDFDTGVFRDQPFDTALIDGGHTPDVVASDTQKALDVLKPGGMCVWHDFCPDPETLSRNLAPLGVVQAVAENFGEWRASFERLFWIRKSWILVGQGKR